MISEPNDNRARSDDSQNRATQYRTSPLLIAVAWAVVGIPALWGVAQTVRTSAKLFQPASATAPVTAQPPAR